MREARFCDFLKLLPGVSERIDQVCDRFESAWQNGRRPLLESHLADTPEPERTALARELIQLEVHYRRQAGEDPKPSDYQDLFPDTMPTWIAEVVAPELDADSVLESSVITPPPVGPSAPAASVVDGIQVPGYEVLGEVGRGGMGVVYKARHLALNRVVALKMIRAQAQAGPGRLARFRAEAEAAARLQHPHIVQIHEIGEHDGNTYLALEFVEGGNLAERIPATPPSCREAAQIVETLAEAMQHAHRRGVVHRDLKPANVLLTENAALKIADFGLAKLMEGGAFARRRRVTSWERPATWRRNRRA